MSTPAGTFSAAIEELDRNPSYVSVAQQYGMPQGHLQTVDHLQHLQKAAELQKAPAKDPKRRVTREDFDSLALTWVLARMAHCNLNQRRHLLTYLGDLLGPYVSNTDGFSRLNRLNLKELQNKILHLPLWQQKLALEVCSQFVSHLFHEGYLQRNPFKQGSDEVSPLNSASEAAVQEWKRVTKVSDAQYYTVRHVLSRLDNRMHATHKEITQALKDAWGSTDSLSARTEAALGPVGFFPWMARATGRKMRLPVVRATISWVPTGTKTLPQHWDEWNSYFKDYDRNNLLKDMAMRLGASATWEQVKAELGKRFDNSEKSEQNSKARLFGRNGFFTLLQKGLKTLVVLESPVLSGPLLPLPEPVMVMPKPVEVVPVIESVPEIPILTLETPLEEEWAEWSAENTSTPQLRSFVLKMGAKATKAQVWEGILAMPGLAMKSRKHYLGALFGRNGFYIWLRDEPVTQHPWENAVDPMSLTERILARQRALSL